MSLADTSVARLPQPRVAFGLTAETQYDKCVALARNLWWSWHADVINLFRDLDPIRWRQLDHNPIALLSEFTPERLEMRAAELVLYSRINQAYRRLKEYLSETPPWGRTHAGVLGSKPVAYFSLEFGVHESVPIYSGGLGVLSGDHIKSASGLGVPLVAIGTVLRPGLFQAAPRHQRLAERGVSRHEGREPADGARPGGRRQADHRPHRHPQRPAAGQGVADARRPRAALPAGLRRAEQQSRRSAS